MLLERTISESTDDLMTVGNNQKNIYGQPKQTSDTNSITGSVGKDGDNNSEDVKKVVGMLKEMGYYHQAHSGIWGSQAQMALENFQRDLSKGGLIDKKDVGKKINSKSATYKQLKMLSIPTPDVNDNPGMRYKNSHVAEPNLNPTPGQNKYLPNVDLYLDSAESSHSNIPHYATRGNSTNQTILPTRGNYWRINNNSARLFDFNGKELKDKKLSNHTRVQIHQDRYINKTLYVFVKSDSGQGYWTHFSNLSLDNFVSTDYYKTQVSGQSHTANCILNGTEGSNSGCKGVSEEMFDDVVASKFTTKYEVGTTSAKNGDNLNNAYLSLMRETYNPDNKNATSPEKLAHMEDVDGNNLNVNPHAWTHYESNMGFDYLDDHLEQGIPMVVGVNHVFQYRESTGINEGTTDHFILITGIGTYQGKKYYTFLDPGTSHYKWGASQKNVLFEESPGIFKAYKIGGSGANTYTLTMVVLLEKDIETYKYHRQWNHEHRKKKMKYKKE